MVIRTVTLRDEQELARGGGGEEPSRMSIEEVQYSLEWEVISQWSY